MKIRTKIREVDSYFSEDLDDELDRIICIAHGLPKTGKSRWSLTAPGRIAYLTNDRSYLPVVRYAQRCGKDISVAKFFFKPPPRSQTKDKSAIRRTQEEARPLFEGFKGAFIAAHHSKRIRSIVVDNGTTVHSLCLSAIHGKVAKILPRDRGDSNEEMLRLYQMSQEFDKNVIWIHRTKELWKNDQPTGVLVPEGWKFAANEVQVVVETSRKHKSQVFKATITDSSYDAGLIGEVLEGEDLSFPHMASLVLQKDREEFEDGVEL